MYELLRGRLIPMATDTHSTLARHAARGAMCTAPTALHTRICDYIAYILKRHFASQNISLVGTSVTGVRTEVDTSRIPDVVVCSEALWSHTGILDFGEVPNLVVEVTSENWREDYIRKRGEYASIDIPEYWIIDPNKEYVWILSNPEGLDGYDRV